MVEAVGEQGGGHRCTIARGSVTAPSLSTQAGGNVSMSACFPCGWHPESRGLSTHMRTSAKYKNTTSPDYSPTREIDQRRPFWRPDDPQYTRIPGSSCS